jgi:hypothetical protein
VAEHSAKNLKLLRLEKTTLLLSAILIGSLLVAAPAGMAINPKAPNFLWASNGNGAKSVNFIGNQKNTLFVADAFQDNGSSYVNYVGTATNDTFLLYGANSSHAYGYFVATDSTANGTFWASAGNGTTDFALSGGKLTNFYLFPDSNTSTTFAVSGGVQSLVYVTGNCSDWVNAKAEYNASNTNLANFTTNIDYYGLNGTVAPIDSMYRLQTCAGLVGGLVQVNPINSVFSINLQTNSSVELGTYFGASDTVNVLF